MAKNQKNNREAERQRNKAEFAEELNPRNNQNRNQANRRNENER